MAKSWKQIYPEDCYRVLLMLSGETGLSFPKVVNIVVREGLIRLGKLPEETSQAHLLQPRPLITKQEKPLTTKEQEEIKKLQATFSNILKNWSLIKPKDRLFWIEKAKKTLTKYGKEKVPNAELVLALANEG